MSVTGGLYHILTWTVCKMSNSADTAAAAGGNEEMVASSFPSDVTVVTNCRMSSERDFFLNNVDLRRMVQNE